jgi:hypothetical protein
MAHRDRREWAIAARAVRDLPRREQERHPLLIAARVPTGSARIANQTQYMAAARASPAFAHYRADGLETLLEIAQVLCDYVDWELGTSRPGHAEIMRRTGRSKRTVTRSIRALLEAGLLGTVIHGHTAGTDPLDPDAGNQAAVYVLAVPHGLHVVAPGRDRRPAGNEAVAGDGQDQAPRGDVAQAVDQALQAAPLPPALTSADSPVDEDGTPSVHLSGARLSLPTRAREADVRGLGPADLVAAGSWWMAGVAPKTKQDRLLAAAELRRLEPILRRPGVSTAAVAAAVREWHLAAVPGTTGQDGDTLPGWLISDLRFALNHRPDGTPWPHQFTRADVRHPIAFLMFRLDSWRTVPGDRTSPPALAPSQRAARARAADAAAHAAQLATDQATRAAAVTPAAIAGWEQARAQQAARAAADRAQTAAARRLTLVPPAEPAAPSAHAPDDPAAATRPAGPGRGRRPGRPAVRAAVRAAGSGLRPVPDTADPRIAALRAAVRARRDR